MIRSYAILMTNKFRNTFKIKRKHVSGNYLKIYLKNEFSRDISEVHIL